MINLNVIFSDVYNIGMAHHRPCQEIQNLHRQCAIPML
ncbi:hypothetical protein AKO64_2842 [Escherichia coli]|nr:hypothetical protein AKO64_2842 [Escherichia coli]